MHKSTYIPVAIIILLSVPSFAFSRAIQAQVPVPDVGGPRPQADGTTTITPGGSAQQGGEQPTQPVAEPVEPTETTPEPQQPETVAPPTVVEPTTPSETRTVPRIDMNEPSTQSTPAGSGAGPSITEEATRTNEGVNIAEEPGTFGNEEQTELIPRAGIGLGWLAIAGSAMTGIGIVLRKKVRKS